MLGGMETLLDPQATALLDFWLGPDLSTPAGLGTATRRWFLHDEVTDAAIRERFGALTEVAANGEFDEWVKTPRGWLALLILLDQFPRNLYRGLARAFAADPKAQHIALDGIERGFDAQLAPIERLFAYLPLEHAEKMELQDRSVALFSALRSAAPAALAVSFDGFVDYAIRHRDVIARFGRFPHRNAALGRYATPAERDYLAQPGTGF